MSASAADDQPIRWVVTTESAAWQEQEAPEYVVRAGIPSVIIDTNERLQVVEGFGAAFSELGWTSLNSLAPDQRDDVLDELFCPGVGANLSVCRTPIGANDIARRWYSYDERAGDLALEEFSVENDLETLIPFIRAAQSRRPDLKLWASPWSPPSWMKTNRHYAAALPMDIPGFSGVDNGLGPDQVGAEGTDMFVQDDAYLDAYARYIGRFVDAYAEHGIRIGMVMPQNEFNSAQAFPSCTWTPAGLARFITHLGPEMARRGVEVFFGTLERADGRSLQVVMADAAAASYIHGAGVQWAGKDALPFIHRDYPGLRIYQTEQECGTGQNDWRFARYAWSLLRHNFTHGANAYMYWNMVLGTDGRSSWGWSQNSLVTVDAGAQQFHFNHDYQVLKHVSHFVQQGAHVLKTLSLTGHQNLLAFINPDRSVVLVLHNDMSVPLPMTIQLGERLIALELPADSFSSVLVPRA
ncbi:glycoside hydrolase family 30 protein [Cellulomonas hominis]